MNKKLGFTLIELMIVVAIIAILFSIAMPSYERYMLRAHRTDGITALQNVMDAQERYFADNRSYSTTLTDLGFTSNTVDSPDKKYRITAQACGAMALTVCVELKATAQGKQVKDGDLIMDSNGKRERSLNGVIEKW